jgi:uncharacterized protein (TIGR03118 family)
MFAIRPRRPVHAPSRARTRRSPTWWLGVIAAAAVLAMVALSPAVAAARGTSGSGRRFEQRNLVSDIAGVARTTDRNLVNPWGLAAGPSTPLWVADNGPGLATLYSGGVNGSIAKTMPPIVRIPGGSPTGAVFNPTRGFVVRAGGASAPANFIFDSEAGTITAWSRAVPPATEAQTVVTTPGAVYKGLAIATVKNQGTFIYAADFHGAKIDVFDSNFAPAHLSGGFVDSAIPAGFAPFNIQQINGNLYVSYAKQDMAGHDEIDGAGLGFVDVYTTSGHLVKRLVSQGRLDAPWGMVRAPSGFGRFSGDLLVGNFGDGMINAYNPSTGRFAGQLTNTDGAPVQIDGLWTLRFGNGTFGTPRTLVFSAGIGGENHGLLGELIAR